MDSRCCKNPDPSRAINEKALEHAPAKDLSFLLHSIFGLDHYPNYLAKWEEAEIEHLEGLLQEQVDKVRDAKSKVRHRNQILQLHRPVYASLWTVAESQPELLLDPQLLTALNRAEKGHIDEIEALVEDVVPYTYRIPLFLPEVCDKILEELENFMEFGVQHEDQLQASNWLTRRHAALQYMGLKDLENMLLEKVMEPIAPRLYPMLADFPLDFRYGYVVSYGPESDERTQTGVSRKGLVPHTDDSEVTLNCCLKDNFDGGRVIFRHLRNSGRDGKLEGNVQPKKGYAIIHLGQHLHEVENVSRGEREALILWTRSTEFRAETCPCCLLHRRQGCICDPSWN